MTSTSQPGHHQTAIQTLDQTLEVDKADLIVLDALRRQRNLSDYEGDPITQTTLLAGLRAAPSLPPGCPEYPRSCCGYRP